MRGNKRISSRTPRAQMQCCGGILFFSQQQKQRRDGGGRTGWRARLRARASASRGGVPTGHHGWAAGWGEGGAGLPPAPIKLSAPGGQKITKFAEHHWLLGSWLLPQAAERRAARSVCVSARTRSPWRGGEPTPHHTVAMMTSRWAMSLTLCSRSGAMRAMFSLENSHEGKMWITYAGC